MIALLADTVTVTDAGAELKIVLTLLVVAIVKAVLSHLDAKKANGTAEAAKADAQATADSAAAKKQALDALVLWIESQKAKAPPPQAKATSASIKAFTESLGVEAAVSEAVTRLTKTTPSGIIDVPKEVA